VFDKECLMESVGWIVFDGECFFVDCFDGACFMEVFDGEWLMESV
jgi:hypothetical protein